MTRTRVYFYVVAFVLFVVLLALAVVLPEFGRSHG